MANTRTKTSPIVSACWAEHTLAIVRVTIILLIHVNPLPIIPSWLLGKPTLPAQRQPQLGTSLQYGTGNTQLTELLCTRNSAGPWFNIKMSSCQYRKSHCGDKTILRPSYLHNGISYTGKMTSLYWIRPQESGSPVCTFGLLQEDRSAVLWISSNSWVVHRTTHGGKLGCPNHFLVAWIIFEIRKFVF